MSCTELPPEEGLESTAEASAGWARLQRQLSGMEVPQLALVRELYSLAGSQGEQALHAMAAFLLGQSGSDDELTRVRAAVLDAMPARIAILDHQANILAVNAGWREFAEADLTDPNPQVGQNYLDNIRCLSTSAADDGTAAAIACGIREVLAGEKELARHLYPWHAATQQCWFRVTTVPLPVGGQRGAVVMHIDVTEQTVTRQRLEYQAHHDSLTGLPNRDLFRDRLGNAMAAARRNRRILAVLFVDLDNFKSINDTLGHTMGDGLLQEVGRRFAGCLRECDTIARLGGDEFAVMLPEIAQQEDAALLAEKLLTTLEEPVNLGGQALHVAASIGIALFPADADTVEDLIRSADSAMYRAKETGRHRYQFFDPEMNVRGAAKLRLEGQLRKALANDEFRLVYQPKVSCRTGGVVGAEALLRWRCPDGQPVPLAEVIALLENTGLIVPVGRWILQTACKQAVSWCGADGEAVSVSVNVSARQLRQESFLEDVKNALELSQLAPGRLVLELTESSLIESTADVIALMRELKQLGVKLSMDDFGTGYSSLSYLTDFPLDEIKIDRSFVTAIEKNASSSALILRTMIAMGHNLGVQVVAEGVETDVQASMLIADTCDVIQGYHFSPPVEPVAMEALLREGRRLISNRLTAGAPQKTLLIVDDEENVLAALRRALRKEDYLLLTAPSAAVAFDVLAQRPVDVIVSDQRMPDMSGIEFLRSVKVMYPDTVRLMLSGYTDLKSVTEAINEGAIYKFLSKPWDEDLLRANISEAFRQKEAADQSRYLASTVASQQTALNQHAIVSIADLQGRISYVNDKFCEISGYQKHELLGRTHAVVNSGIHPESFFAEMWNTISQGKTWHGEICNRRKDGSHYWVESTIVPTLDAAGLPSQYVSIRTGITHVMQLKEEIATINAELQTRVTQRTAELDAAVTKLRAEVAERRQIQQELESRNRELEALNQRLSDSQNQLLQSEKMASIGQLAAGVAHEINNPIGYVYSNIGTLENYIHDLFELLNAYERQDPAVEAIRQAVDFEFLRSDVPALMSESREGIGRVRKIIQDLKDFSRADSNQEWQLADIHRGLDSTLNIVANEIKYRAEVVKDYASDVPPLECLPAQLNQVFLNLLVNAAQAMQDGHGLITLSTRLVGQEVHVAVTDTGSGVPTEIVARIFDPFFTTKPVGQGTGLGLSVSHSIVRKHGGRIEVESAPGQGSTFRVILPLRQVGPPEPDAAGAA